MPDAAVDAMRASEHFSQSYAEAREKFLLAAHARGACIERHAHPKVRGADNEELSIDVIVLDGAGAERVVPESVLLLTSATHGVEGFCGSGCQLSLLEDEAFLREAAAARVALVFVHAVNPYGFSHLRRVNEDNADLNRNFVDFGVALPENPAYAELHALLLPPTWPPAPENEARLGAWIKARGPSAYQAAVSGGQYRFPDGMFYGGAGPSWSNGAMRQILREHIAQYPQLAWIDFHTGLGPAGHAEKIYAGRNDPHEFARVGACWGDGVTSFYDGSSTSARVTGVLCGAVYEECPSTESAMIALEYGTVSIQQVFQACRAEHWITNHPDAPAAQRDAIKREFRDAFYTDTDEWKRKAAAQAYGAAREAIAYLAGGARCRPTST